MLDRIKPISVLHRKLYRKFAADILKRDFIRRNIYGRPMILPIRTPGIGQILAIFGERERDQHYIIKHALQQGDVVLDIGANIGYYAIVEFNAVGPEGRIFAYEPDPRNVEFLRKNLQINSANRTIEIHQEAVSDRDGTATFHVAEKSNLNSMHVSRGDTSEDLIQRGMNNRKYVSEIIVPTRSLGSILAQSSRPINLIRMDIEGHEVEVLQSLLMAIKSGLSRDRIPQKIIFEPHSWEYVGEPNSLHRVLLGLSELGFRIRMLGSRNEPSSPISALGYRPKIVIPERRGVIRGVFENIPQDEAVRLASSVDGVTTVYLERQPSVA